MISASSSNVMESVVVSQVILLLRKQGYRVRCEVPNMGQSADIVATRGRWVTFIEAKVAHWRRALRQCTAHEQVADYICVALGGAQLAREFLAAARERGYGIIHYNVARDECAWVLPPRRNPNVWKPQRLQWAAHLRMIDYAHD